MIELSAAAINKATKTEIGTLMNTIIKVLITALDPVCDAGTINDSSVNTVIKFPNNVYPVTVSVVIL